MLNHPATKPKPKSAWLQAQFVLLTYSGRIRKYYKLGEEFGKGNYGVTSLCMEKATEKSMHANPLGEKINWRMWRGRLGNAPLGLES
jgi:hypothetical protein